MLSFSDTKITNVDFYGSKRSMKILDADIDNIAISKSIETRAWFKCLAGYLEDVTLPFVLI